MMATRSAFINALNRRRAAESVEREQLAAEYRRLIRQAHRGELGDGDALLDLIEPADPATPAHRRMQNQDGSACTVGQVMDDLKAFSQIILILRDFQPVDAERSKIQERLQALAGRIAYAEMQLRRVDETIDAARRKAIAADKPFAFEDVGDHIPERDRIFGELRQLEQQRDQAREDLGRIQTVWQLWQRHGVEAMRAMPRVFLPSEPFPPADLACDATAAAEPAAEPPTARKAG